MKAALRSLAIGVVLFTFTSLVSGQGTFVVDNTANADTATNATSGGLFFINPGTGPALLDPTVYPTLNASVFAGSSRDDALTNGFCHTFVGDEALAGLDYGMFLDFVGYVFAADNVPLNGTTTIVLQVWLGTETNYAAAVAAGEYAAEVTFTNPTGGGGIPAAPAASLTGMPAVILTALPAPPSAVTVTPANVTTTAGQNASFTASAQGTPPLSYQWQFNGGNINGTTNPTLILNNVLGDVAGNYSVVITNAYGSVTSSFATLAVVDPTIVSQPTNRTNIAGTTATFTVGATGSSPLTFQWYKDGTPLADGARVSGSATATLTLSKAQAAESGNYSAVITNAYGSVTSTAAKLTVVAGSTFIPATNRVDMVHDASRGLLYITASNQVLRYDLNRGTFLAPFVFGTNLCSIDISPDNNTLVVADTAAYNSTNVWVYVVDLPSGTNRQGNFQRGYNEGGTYAVAFGFDGAAVITSTFLGAGQAPMRRYDPLSGQYAVVNNPDQNSMVGSSGDGRRMCVVQPNPYGWPVQRYDVSSQTITGLDSNGYGAYEVGVNRNGSQFALLTQYGTFICDTNLNQIGRWGTNTSECPIGVAYDPQADLAFSAWVPTSFLRVSETHTLAEVARYDCGYSFSWAGNPMVTGSPAFLQGRVRSSRDGYNIFVTVGSGVRWISKLVFPPADLALDLAGPSSPVNAGGNLTYTITVSNNGPNLVTDARVFDRLPAGVTFLSATSPQGVCTQSNGLVTCTLNALTNGGNATVSIVIMPPLETILTNTAAVYSSANDANPENNSSSLLTTVHGTASMAVMPAAGLTSSGTTGGPFNPYVQNYTLTNDGTAQLSWQAFPTANWVGLSSTSGTLAPGQATTITAYIGSTANSLSAGNYTDSVTFTNLTNGTGTTTRGVSLTVVPVGILTVTPASGLNSFGPRGGPFSPVSQVYSLTNIADGSLTWTATANSNWIALSATAGLLSPGASTNVVVSIAGAATNLARGRFNGTIGITNVTSGRGNTSFAVTMTVNTAPVASPQNITLLEDGSTLITLQGTDADYDALTAAITALPAHGTLFQTADGVTPTTAITAVPTAVSNPSNKIVFMLGQHGYGPDYGDFSFKVNDGLADSTDAQVTANVTHVNHPPVAVNDVVPFFLGTTQVVFNVLANDADVDGDPLSVQSFTTPARGMLSQVNSGQFRYQPNPDFTNGLDQFSYTIADGQGGTATAQVTFKPCNQPLQGGDWPTFGNGPSHTGYYPGMLGGSTFVAGWSNNIGGYLSQVAVGGGNVYVSLPSSSGNPGTVYLTALDAVSGMPVWQHNFPGSYFLNPPTYDHGRVYVQHKPSSTGAQLWCIDAADGSVIWNAPQQSQYLLEYYAPTVYGDGIWLGGGTYGGMYGFSTNGTQNFFFGWSADYEWTPTYYQGTVYSCLDGYFQAHDPLTGSVLWNFNFDQGYPYSGFVQTVSAIDGGRAFVRNQSNLSAVDLTRHTNIWTSGGGVTGSPAVANGIAYAIIGDGVQALSAQDGTSLGVYKATNDTGLFWQPIITDDALFISSFSATYVFDLASHNLLQKIPYGGPLSLANGWLYIAGYDGWVHAYIAPNTPAIVSQPVGQKVTVGQSAGFSVTVGGRGPFTYQWMFNTVSILGATNAALTLNNVQLSQTGNYTVVVSNAVGSVLSSNAVLAVNSAPVALPQTVTLPEDGSTVITLQGTDVDNDALTATITTLPAHGTLYQTADGIKPTQPITFIPAPVSNPSNKVVFVLAQHGYGPDYADFSFKLNDGLADSTNAQVTVNVTHVNHSPVAADEVVPFFSGSTQVVFDVLANDADVDGDPLTVQSFTAPARGVLTQINNGQFRYQPNPDFTNGLDQFTYIVADGQGGTATAQVMFKACSQALQGGDWPTFGNGPSHTGYYPGMLGGATFVAGWSTNFGIALNQVAIGGGSVYVTPNVTNGPGYLAAMDAASGQPVWQTNFNSAWSINPPTCDRGRVYVQRVNNDVDTQLWCVNAADGNVVWNAPHEAQWDRFFAPTVYGDGIWVGGGYFGGFYGFSTNGTQRFFNRGLDHYDQWTPTYSQGTVYSWVNGSFRAHDPLTGAALWTFNYGWTSYYGSMNTVSAIDGGHAFVQYQSTLIAIDLNTHSDAWIAGGGVTGSPAVANGVAYAIIGDGVQAFSAQDGRSLGVYKATNDTGLAWQPIATDDALFISSPSATYVFDLASRQLLQKIPYGGPLSLANGWLYIAGQDGWLRAYTIAPSIFNQPVSQTVYPGGSASFSVAAAGTPPLTYQWQLNGRDIPGATNASLTVTNIAPALTGNYAALVSNPYGSVTSAPALLRITPRALVVQPSAGMPGGSVTVPVNLVSDDRENSIAFSLAYDTNVLALASATNGADAADAAFSVQPGPGRVGISLTRPAGVAYSSGQYTIALLTFKVAPGSNTLATALTFADSPVVRVVRDTNGLALPALPVAGAVLMQAPGSIALSPGSSLFQQVIRITNPANAGGTVSNTRLWFQNLGVDSKGYPIRIYNATGTSNGVPYIDYATPLSPGQSVNLTVQYYIADRTTIPHPTITVEFTATQTLLVPDGTAAAVTFRFVNGTGVVEFSTLSGHTYYVQYAADSSGTGGWKTVLPAITGTGGIIQWIDCGPPGTDSAPGAAPLRFYRVLLAP
jgi:uncharacterized repeat protein (TIGR01451 family)